MPNITYTNDDNGGGVAGTDDQTAAEVTFTPTGNVGDITATDVQAALEELDGARFDLVDDDTFATPDITDTVAPSAESVKAYVDAVIHYERLVDLDDSAATFDGTTDDSAAIQALLNAEGADTAFWMGRSFAVDSPLTFPAGSILLGAPGATIIGTNTAADVVNAVGDLTIQDVSISGGLVGVDTAVGTTRLSRVDVDGTASHAVRVSGVALRADQCTFSNAGVYGVNVFNADAVLTGCTATGNLGGFVHSAGGRSRYTSCEAINNTGSGFLSAHQIDGFAWTGCAARDNGQSGFTVGRTDATNTDTSQNWTITSCIATGNGSHGFWIDLTSDDPAIIWDAHATTSSCIANDNGIHGFYLNHAASIVIGSCHAESNGNTGFLVGDSSHITLAMPMSHSNTIRGVGVFGGGVAAPDDISVWGHKSTNEAVDRTNDGLSTNVVFTDDVIDEDELISNDATRPASQRSVRNIILPAEETSPDDATSWSTTGVLTGAAYGAGLYRPYLDSDRAWFASSNVANDTLTLDLGSIQEIDSVVTQGNSGADQWVTEYDLYLSDDGVGFAFLGRFSGNFDRDTKVSHVIRQKARFVRWQPVPAAIVGHTAMRAGVTTVSPLADATSAQYTADAVADELTSLWGNYRLKDYGKLGVGNDAAVLQACIDAVAGDATGTGRAGLTGATIRLEGLIELEATVYLRQNSVRFIGTGAHVNERNSFLGPNGNASNGTVIRWVGASGVPMFHYRDIREVFWSAVRFEGSDANTPSAAHQFESISGDANGANIGKTFVDCQFGQWRWSPVNNGADFTGNLAVGILLDGENANNDRLRVLRSRFRRCDVGISIVNGQSVWGRIDDTEFESCATGIASAANLQAVNIQIQSCDRGLDLSSFATSTIEMLNSERTRELARLRGGSRLYVKGGYSQVPAQTGGTFAALNGHFIDATECTAPTEIIFREHQFTDPFGHSPFAPITLQPAAGANLVTQDAPKIGLFDCPLNSIGDALTTADLYAGCVNLVDAQDYRVIEGNDENNRYFRTILNGQRDNGAEVFNPENYEIGEGLIMRSPDGERWRVTISNAGVLATAVV